MWRRGEHSRALAVSMGETLIGLIDRATEVTGVSRSEFIRSAAIEKLERLSLVSTLAKHSLEDSGRETLGGAEPA